MILTKNPNEDIRSPAERVISDTIKSVVIAEKTPRNLYSSHTVSFSPIMTPALGLYADGFISPTSPDQFAPIMLNNSAPQSIGMGRIDAMRLNFAVGWWENPFLRDFSRTPNDFSIPVYFGLGSYNANYNTPISSDYKFRYFINYKIGKLIYNSATQQFFLSVDPQSLDLFDTTDEREFVENVNGLLIEDFSLEGHKLSKSALETILQGDISQLMLSIILDISNLPTNENLWLVNTVDAGSLKFTPSFEITKSGLLV